jgi:cell division initiation protein
MEEKHAKFRIMKKGYDRFAVDDHIERLQFELETKDQQLQSYIRQVESASEQLSLMKQRYQSLVTELAVREKAADDIARLALKEANNVIHSAQNNADAILQEALSTARMILIEISRIAREAHGLKKDMREQLKALSQTLDAFEVPKFPSISIIQEEQDEEQDAPQ